MRHRYLRRAERRHGSFTTKPRREISALTLGLRRRWHTFRSADGKKASSAFCTGKGRTPWNFSPSQRSWLNGGRDRKRVSFNGDFSARYLSEINQILRSAPAQFVLNFNE